MNLKKIVWQNQKNKRGQAVVIDLFVAIFVFIIILSIITILWNKYNVELDNKIVQKDMWVKTFQITDMLTESKGTPTNWEQSIKLDNETNMSEIVESVDTLGLIDLNKQLSKEKIEIFMNLSDFRIPLGLTISCDDYPGYCGVKEIMNIEPYEFYLRLFDATALIYESGYNPHKVGSGESVNRVTSLRRYVYSDFCYENLCVLEFSLWN